MGKVKVLNKSFEISHAVNARLKKVRELKGLRTDSEYLRTALMVSLRKDERELGLNIGGLGE